MHEPRSIRCEEALRLLALFLDHELGDPDAVAVEQHLATCRGCFSRAEFERRLRTELADLRSVDLPPTLDRRIRELIGEPQLE